MSNRSSDMESLGIVLVILFSGFIAMWYLGKLAFACIGFNTFLWVEDTIWSPVIILMAFGFLAVWAALFMLMFSIIIVL